MKKLNVNISQFVSIFFLSGMLLLSSCSGNSDEETPQEEDLSEVVMQNFITELESITVPSGLSNSQNTYAQSANLQFILLQTSASAFTSFFMIPENAVAAKTIGKYVVENKSNTTQTYSWSADGYSITYTITENSDRYNYEYNIVSPNFTGELMNGYQLKDGSYAELNWFAFGDEGFTMKWWLTDTTTKIEYDYGYETLEMESNTTDNSGSIKVYEEGVLSESFVWDASGSGTYTNYTSNETFTW